MKSCLLVALLAVALAGCGQKLSGTYVPKGKAGPIGHPFDKFEFVSGSNVDIFTGGPIIRATYKVEGNRLVVTGNGGSTVLMIDDKGCLDAGKLMGKYCKK
jgi:hypothetical protein